MMTKNIFDELNNGVMDESVGISISQVLQRNNENIYVTKILPHKSVNRLCFFTHYGL